MAWFSPERRWYKGRVAQQRGCVLVVTWPARPWGRPGEEGEAGMEGWFGRFRGNNRRDPPVSVQRGQREKSHCRLWRWKLSDAQERYDTRCGLLFRGASLSASCTTYQIDIKQGTQSTELVNRHTAWLHQMLLLFLLFWLYLKIRKHFHIHHSNFISSWLQLGK